jgi:hypothetical protein
VKEKSKSGWGRPRPLDKAHGSKRKQHKHKNKDADANDCSPLDVALQYAAEGLPVFPLYGTKAFGCSCGCPDRDCKRAGKHPRVNEATTDKKLVKRYWTKWPDAEIGLPLGSSSGFLALAADGSTGRKTLRTLEEKAK